MAFFHSREETDREIIIRFKPFAPFVMLLSIGLMLVFNSLGINADYALMIFFVLMLIYLIDSGKVIWEIKKATTRGFVEVSGSKYSFKSPMIFKIKK